MDLALGYCYEEVKRCFLCNAWIEGQIKRHKVNNILYYYHLDCFSKVQKHFHYKSLNSSSIKY